MLKGDQTKSALGLMVVPAVLALALLTGGCNTMRGVGEDVQAAGGAMSDTAEETEEMMTDEEGMEETEEEMMDEGTAGDQTQ